MKSIIPIIKVAHISDEVDGGGKHGRQTYQRLECLDLALVELKVRSARQVNRTRPVAAAGSGNYLRLDTVYPTRFSTLCIGDLKDMRTGSMVAWKQTQEDSPACKLGLKSENGETEKNKVLDRCVKGVNGLPSETSFTSRTMEHEGKNRELPVCTARNSTNSIPETCVSIPPAATDDTKSDLRCNSEQSLATFSDPTQSLSNLSDLAQSTEGILTESIPSMSSWVLSGPTKASGNLVKPIESQTKLLDQTQSSRIPADRPKSVMILSAPNNYSKPTQSSVILPDPTNPTQCQQILLEPTRSLISSDSAQSSDIRSDPSQGTNILSDPKQRAEILSENSNQTTNILSDTHKSTNNLSDPNQATNLLSNLNQTTNILSDPNKAKNILLDPNQTNDILSDPSKATNILKDRAQSNGSAKSTGILPGETGSIHIPSNTLQGIVTSPKASQTSSSPDPSADEDKIKSELENETTQHELSGFRLVDLLAELNSDIKQIKYVNRPAAACQSQSGEPSRFPQSSRDKGLVAEYFIPLGREGLTRREELADGVRLHPSCPVLEVPAGGVPPPTTRLLTFKTFRDASKVS